MFFCLFTSSVVMTGAEYFLVKVFSNVGLHAPSFVVFWHELIFMAKLEQFILTPQITSKNCYKSYTRVGEVGKLTEKCNDFSFHVQRLRYHLDFVITLKEKRQLGF